MKKGINDFGENLTKQQLIELDACVNCGECLNFCPIQDVTGEPQIGPPERIKVIKEWLEISRGLRGKVFGPKEIGEEQLKNVQDMMWKCVLCGGCGEVCEVGIDSKKLWWSLRRAISESKIGIPTALKGSVENYHKYHSPFPKDLSQRYKIWLPDDIEVADKAEVGLYEGCGGAWDNPQASEGAARLLSAGGPFTMLDAEDSWCCGWPQVAGPGDWSILPELVSHLITAVINKGIKRLAFVCPMCRDIFLWLYPEYYGNELPFECVMVTELIAEYIEQGRINFSKTWNDTVTNHDPCAMARPLVGPPIFDAPRKVLQSLPGVTLVEMDRTRENVRCCGGSAGQRAINPDLAARMGQNLLMEAVKSGANTIVTSCVVCYASLAARAHFVPTKVVDEWKQYQEPIRINDLCQYAARFL